MKKILLTVLCAFMFSGCVAAAVGLGAGVGGYYYGKHNQASYDAYNAYVKDCQTKGTIPMAYNDWVKIK
jgi:hypothetical protein